MNIRYLPALQLQRDLYALPRNGGRFKAYIAAMGADQALPGLPLTYMNPMAREIAAERLDALLALNADAIAAAAVAEAQQRLTTVPGELRLCLVLVDDTGGGWTDRCLTDARHRFENEYEVRHGFATGLLWTKDEPLAEAVRCEALAGIYRAVYQRSHGQPTALAQMLRQEGLTARFAGETARLSVDAIARSRRIMAPLVEGASYPTAIACLYGDQAAISAGYQPLDLPLRAGFELALAGVFESGEDPVAALQQGAASHA